MGTINLQDEKSKRTSKSKREPCNTGDERKQINQRDHYEGIGAEYWTVLNAA